MLKLQQTGGAIQDQVFCVSVYIKACSQQEAGENDADSQRKMRHMRKADG